MRTKGIQRFLLSLDPRGLYWFTKRISDNFGYKFTLLLSSSYYGVKGVGYYYAKDALLPYAQQVDMSGENLQLNSTISTTPWSIKGFIGVITDSFALFGYEKKYYMIITTILSSVACFLLIVLPYSLTESFALTPGLILFFVHLQGSCLDLLCEGKYVQKMRELPHTRGDVVTYIWFCQTVGNLLPSFTVGVIADYTDPRYIYIIALPFCAQPLIFLFMNCMVDDKVPPHLSNRFNNAKWKIEWQMMTLALIHGCLVLVNMIVSLTIESSNTRLIITVVISVILVILAFLMMDPIVAKGNIYIFIIRMLYLSINGFTEKFYLATPDCVHNGPNFSFVFFRTYTSIVSNIFNFVGLFFFQLYVQRWNFRPAFWVTTVLRVVASIFDIIIIERWNISIGIPDEVLYMVGTAAILETVYMMDFMPMNLLIAKLCPRYVETTMYAILAGYMNFGSTMASHLGIFVADSLKIDTTLPTHDDPTPCDFSNLSLVVAIGHLILPLLSVPLTFYLIPNARVDDNIIEFNRKVGRETPEEIKRMYGLSSV